MFHEIYPKEYRVAYGAHTPTPNDCILLFDGDKVCCRLESDKVIFPVLREFGITGDKGFCYLFSIVDEMFFTPDMASIEATVTPDGYAWHDCNIFRTVKPKHLAFAIVTARHLYQWYLKNKHCGCCGSATTHSQTERALICAKCGHIIYPSISPAVIVAVINGDCLLVTRNNSHPHLPYILVSGFAEVGESLEDAVKREVFEETGVHVKNITYYKSQPWGLTSTMLAGYFCELDGDETISIDKNELSEALWLHRNDIPPVKNEISLTSEMIEAFRVNQRSTY